MICKLTDIPDGRARGFVLSMPRHSGRDCRNPDHRDVIHDEVLHLFIVRRGNKAYAYQNTCPHKGVNLDWQPDEFMSEDGEYIQCSTHGALFQIDDGLCVAGPCVGAHLKRIPITIDNDLQVWLTTTR